MIKKIHNQSSSLSSLSQTRPPLLTHATLTVTDNNDFSYKINVVKNQLLDGNMHKTFRILADYIKFIPKNKFSYSFDDTKENVINDILSGDFSSYIKEQSAHIGIKEIILRILIYILIAFDISMLLYFILLY